MELYELCPSNSGCAHRQLPHQYASEHQSSAHIESTLGRPLLHGSPRFRRLNSSLATIHKPIEQSSLDYNVAVLTETENELRAIYIHNNATKYSQKAALITYADDYVFVAPQTPSDTVAALAGHLYCNNLTVQKTLEALASTGAIEMSDA